MRLALGMMLGGAVVPPFDEDSIDWYTLHDFSRFATLGITGGVIDSCADASGNGDSNRDATATGTARATYNAANSNFNNQPTADFDTTDDWLRTGTFTAMSTTCTWLAVMRFTTPGANESYVVNGTGGAGQSLYNVGDLRIYAGSSEQTIDSGTPSGVIVACIEWAGAATKFYVNTTTGTTVAASPGTAAVTRLIIGNHNGGAPYGIGGSIAIVGTVNSHLDPAVRTAAIEHYASKYGVTLL